MKILKRPVVLKKFRFIDLKVGSSHTNHRVMPDFMQIIHQRTAIRFAPQVPGFSAKCPAHCVPQVAQAP
jgi:hypothetical protein